jgi:hypothetical protein
MYHLLMGPAASLMKIFTDVARFIVGLNGSALGLNGSTFEMTAP